MGGNRTNRESSEAGIVKWAEVSIVEAMSEQWQDAIVQCRIYGHAWRPLTVRRHGLGFVVTQSCHRCRNMREQNMDSRGYGTPWKMRYEDGYLLTGLGRIDQEGRAVLRLAAIRHLTIIEEEDES